MKSQVLIQESGQKRNLVVGVVCEGYDFHKLPGDEDGSSCYRIDDGTILFDGHPFDDKDLKGTFPTRTTTV